MHFGNNEDTRAPLLGYPIYLLELVLVELEEALVLAVRLAKRILIVIRLLEPLLGQNALHRALLKFDGVRLHMRNNSQNTASFFNRSRFVK